MLVLLVHTETGRESVVNQSVLLHRSGAPGSKWKLALDQAHFCARSVKDIHKCILLCVDADKGLEGGRGGGGRRGEGGTGGGGGRGGEGGQGGRGGPPSTANRPVQPNPPPGGTI